MDESISPIEAIRFALKKEEESYRFYSEAAAKTNDPGTPNPAIDLLIKQHAIKKWVLPFLKRSYQRP